MQVRERADADLPACVQLARAVHERDGYPHYLPGDLRDFLVLPDAYGAWVGRHRRLPVDQDPGVSDGTYNRGLRPALLAAVRAQPGPQALAGRGPVTARRYPGCCPGRDGRPSSRGVELLREPPQAAKADSALPVKTPS